MIHYAIFAAGAAVLHLVARLLVRRPGWRKANFQGRPIPSVSGLYIVAYGVIGCALARYTSAGSDTAARLYLVAILGFGLLGLADDIFGSRKVSGFRGHFKMLYLQKRLTTGAAKAIGGGLIAVYLGWRASGGAAGLWVLDAAIVALAANTLNLLDVRPGRALFVFFVGLAAAAGLAWARLSGPIPLAAVALAAAVAAHWDVRGLAMLGDVGSNTLGAVLGLMLALDVGLAGKLAAFLLFLAINVYSERRSISELIERHPTLASIDSKLGVR